jgi:Zn-dependent protease
LRETGWPGFPLTRVLGIRIVVDWSVLVIFALVAANLGLGVFPSWHPTWSAGLVWGLAIAAALLFFASILVHELSHAIVARLFGIPVQRITLFVFGGMAHMEREPSSPRAELAIAAAGPIASLTIGAAATLLASGSMGKVEDPTSALRSLGPGTTLLLWLGPINLVLGLFNLIPGFPLDGGRMLRAALWAITKNLRTATRWATRVGIAVAWVIIAIGITVLLSGGVLEGLWLGLIGWFLSSAARASGREM